MPIANHLEQAGFGVRREENLDFVGDKTPLRKFDWVVLDMALSRRAVQSFCEKMWADQPFARGLTLLCDETIDKQDRENLCQSLGAQNCVFYTESLATIRAAIESGIARDALTTESVESPPAVTALLEQVEGNWNGNDYKILGISRDDNAEAIEKAYHVLALNLHPDRHRHIRSRDKALFERFNRVFKRVNEVYLRLSDPQQRNLYDLELWIRARSRSEQRRWGIRQDVELRMCTTSRGRALVSRSLKERFFGRWRSAEESMAQAVAIEGADSELNQVLESIRRIRDLTNS